MIFPSSEVAGVPDGPYLTIGFEHPKEKNTSGGDKNISKGNAKQLSVGSFPHPRMPVANENLAQDCRF